MSIVGRLRDVGIKYHSFSHSFSRDFRIDLFCVYVALLRPVDCSHCG